MLETISRRGIIRALASMIVCVVSSYSLAQQAALPAFEGMTYEQKLGFMGEYSAEEIFGIGTPEYARAARAESERHPCTILEDPGRGATASNTWPDGIVPYAFNANVNTTNQNRARAAMDEIEAIAPVRFIERTDQSSYIVFNDSTVNSSFIGIQGGPQTVNMVSWSVRFIIVHELMHALGIYHEQQRPDRDEYVSINFGNIQSGASGNFTVRSNAGTVGSYDFGSVMHYGQCFFSVCSSCNASCRTITVLPPNEDQQSQIGQRSQLSESDIATINALYGGGTTSLPVQDDFESELDTSVWFAANGADVSTSGINEPSGTQSANIGGTQSLRTLSIDARFNSDFMLSYAWQRTGNGDSPEPGEDLVVEYFDGLGEWIELDRHLGSGVDMTVFESNQIPLPPDAQQQDLRVRFRNLSNNTGFDDYFVDDVSLTSQPALPTSFDLVVPADGASGVALSPTFDWGTADAVTGYRLVIDDEPSFEDPVRLDIEVTTSFFSNPGFNLVDEGTTFYWKVEALNANGSTPSTPDVASFTTVGTPCQADCDGSGTVDFNDLVSMLFRFGQSADVDCDVTNSGEVEFNDLVAALFRFGPCD